MSLDRPWIIQVPNTSPLRSAMASIINRNPSQDVYQGCKRTLQITALAVSAISKVPFIPIAMRLGNTLGPCCAAGNCWSFLVLEFWAINDVIEEFLGSKTEAEHALLQTSSTAKSCCAKTIITGTALFFALASQLPTSLAGAHFNRPDLKVAAFLTLLVAGSLIPIRSLQLSVEGIGSKCQAHNNPPAQPIRSQLIRLVEAHAIHFTNLAYADKLTLIQKHAEIRSQPNASDEDKLTNYMELLHNETIPKTDSEYSVSNVLGFVIGGGLAGILEYVLCDYTFDQAKKEIANNNLLGRFFEGCVGISTSYLFGWSSVKTTQKVLNTAAQAFTGNEFRNIGWQVRPCTSFILTFLGATANLFGLGPSYEIFGDYYKNDAFKQKFFRASVCTAFFLITFTSTLSLINRVTLYLMSKGTDEEKSIAEQEQDFQKMIHLLKTCPDSAIEDLNPEPRTPRPEPNLRRHAPTPSPNREELDDQQSSESFLAQN